MSFPTPQTLLSQHRQKIQTEVDAALRNVEAQLRAKRSARYYDKSTDVLDEVAATVRAAGWKAEVTPAGSQRDADACLVVTAP